MELTAQVFSVMQETRVKLLGMGGRGAGDSISARQDIVLGQMLSDMNDAFKNKFMRIIDGDLYEK